MGRRKKSPSKNLGAVETRSPYRAALTRSYSQPRDDDDDRYSLDEDVEEERQEPPSKRRCGNYFNLLEILDPVHSVCTLTCNTKNKRCNMTSSTYCDTQVWCEQTPFPVCCCLYLGGAVH